MIPVSPQPEPKDFDRKVRQKGLRFLKKSTNPSGTLSKDMTFPPYWLDCLDELHTLYGGICAYLAVFVERVTGAVSCDHFVPKSKAPTLAYEWKNYRLACARMNTRKGARTDILDPFRVQPGWFCLELVSGRIYPNPNLPPSRRKKVQTTIERLGLDDTANRNLRADHYEGYLKGYYTSEHLKRQSPFVYEEARRQGLL